MLEFKIESYALRRRLSQVLQHIYKDRFVIFTQFSRHADTFTVRKWRDKSENFEDSTQTTNGQNSKVKKDIKISEAECEISDYDKIIRNLDNDDRKNVKVLHEDPICIAFEEPFTPAAECHIVVVAKDKELCFQSAPAEVIGKMTLVAS